MEYKCKLERLDRISSKEDNENISLCSKCSSLDCSNPIQNVSISIFGINTRIRAYVTPNSVFAVKSCEGYSIESHASDSDSDSDSEE